MQEFFAVFPLATAVAQLAVSTVFTTEYFVPLRFDREREREQGTNSFVGESFGHHGEFALAYFPWDSGYSAGLALVLTSFFVSFVMRFSLRDAWDESERAALDDAQLGEGILNTAVGLTLLWYPLASRVTRTGNLGLACAVLQAGVVLVAAVLATAGLALVGSFQSGRLAPILFGELTYGLFVGALWYFTVIAGGVAFARYKREPMLGYRKSIHQHRLKDREVMEGLYDTANADPMLAAKNAAQKLQKLTGASAGVVAAYRPLGFRVGTKGTEGSRALRRAELSNLRLTDSARHEKLKLNTVPYQRSHQGWPKEGENVAHVHELSAGAACIAVLGATVALALPSPLAGLATLVGLRYGVVQRAPLLLFQSVAAFAALGGAAIAIERIAKQL